MDAYYHLAQRLNTHALGAPERDELHEILHLIFTPEEAELALHLGWRPDAVERIAEKAGLPVDRAFALCESMANKGVVYAYRLRDRMVYALLPTAPGIYEYSMMIGNLPPATMERLGKLWQHYYDNGWGKELHGAPTNFARVLPHSGAVAENVTVLPFEEAARYIREADYVALGNCPCRMTKQSCDKPLEVCLAFGYAAQFMVERKASRAITQQEAQAVLRQAEEAGLVHCSSNTLDKIDFICNCCPCCCGILGAATRVKDAASRPHSNFYSTIDEQACTACAICEDRCPVDAIRVNGTAKVDTELCIGCGLCYSACAFDAVALQRKSDVAPPVDHAALMQQIAAEKKRSDVFRAYMRAS